MNFEWKIEKGKEPTFDERVHNLACFEIVLNILRMKTKAGENNIEGEMQALCGFALECMFKDTNLEDDDMFDTIMQLKDRKVNKFRAKLLKDTGVPHDAIMANEIGEA